LHTSLAFYDYTFARFPDEAEHIPYEEYDKIVARVKVKKQEYILKI